MYERCEKLRPTLFRLASDTTDDDEALGTVSSSRRRQLTPESVGPVWGALDCRGASSVLLTRKLDGGF